MAAKKRVVFGLLGTTLDVGKGENRWQRWRPTVAAASHEDLQLDRLELWHGSQSAELAEIVARDVQQLAPECTVVKHVLDVKDPWDFELMYGALHDFARSYPFDIDREEYLVHITTGTHVAQICLFLLTEARYFPARLLQTSPGSDPASKIRGRYSIVDLDLSRYDRLASRFRREKLEGLSFLKAGIETKNAAFNRTMERIEHVALHSRAPVLLTGPTGAGKSQLARRIYELKKSRRQLTGAFAEVNCATLRGDLAMSALFGHVKGAFTGAAAERPGLLRKAHQGLLFLDELAELGLDEQAMLLRAVEERVFTPLGSDREVSSDFQLLCGTNRDLGERVAQGTFRADLLARINLWTFRLPGLAERPEDIAPNLEFELRRASEALGTNVTLSREARARYLAFASSSEALWHGNFRDLNGSVTRMATLAHGGRITLADVESELTTLRALWRAAPGEHVEARAELVSALLGPRKAAELDRFDRVQLEEVLGVCARARSLSDAGRELFAHSRTQRSRANDADRLRKYLARFGLEFARVKAGD